jgi:hypothetical protein
MKIKASGRSALILATALFVCFSAPSQATERAEEVTASVEPETAASAPIVLHTPAKRGSRHGKKHAERKPSKVVHKSSAGKKSDEAAAEDGAAPTAITPALANANAKLASADTAALNARAMFAQANDMLQTPSSPPDAQPAPPTDVVSADQLNDVDRALHESAPPAPTAAMAAAATPDPTPAPAKPAATSSAESSAWDQTSLIGKIFIGFGALLTMASAARMFMT